MLAQTNLRVALTAPVFAAAALALAGCGSLVDNEQMYDEFEQECRASLPEGLGTELAAQMCDCSAKKMREKEYGPFDLMDEEKMNAIADECAREMPGLMPPG